MLSPFDLSPLLVFYLLGIWGAVFLVRNYFSSDPYYSIRGFRFHKVHAPGWFLLLTLAYLAMTALFIALPICVLWAARWH